MKQVLLDAAAALYGAGWEARRRLYARGVLRPRRVPARVVSIGNLSVGGTGKTTLTLHLARRALEAGVNAAVVCRRYRPGPGGRGDEELLYRNALGAERVHAGESKLALAAAAAALGRTLVLVDDGFSHWPLARDLDLVLIDASEPPECHRLLPAGRLREPWRALQRAELVVLSRVPAEADPAALFERLRRLAPGACFAAGRHRLAHVVGWDGAPRSERGRARLVTATGNPMAVERTAREAGFDLRSSSFYRDHHWFRPDEARRELAMAEREGATLLLTRKDAVRWPEECGGDRTAVLEVEWEWLAGGSVLEQRVLGDSGARADTPVPYECAAVHAVNGSASPREPR